MRGFRAPMVWVEWLKMRAWRSPPGVRKASTGSSGSKGPVGRTASSRGPTQWMLPSLIRRRLFWPTVSSRPSLKWKVVSANRALAWVTAWTIARRTRPAKTSSPE